VGQSFSEEDSYAVHFPHNDALVVTTQIRSSKVSKILVDGGNSINILYGHALDRMENTPKLARKLIIPRIQLLLYGFDGNEARSPDTIEFPVRADPFNILTEFCILDIPSPYNAIRGRSWIYMMRAVSSTHHQLLKYPTPFEMANIRGEQAMSRTIAGVALKRSGWMPKASRINPNEDSLVDKKQKRVGDQ